MRYLGSKAKLIDFIHEAFKKYDIKGQVFCDLFAGTSCVADSFKDSYEIISNDFMYYSFCFSKAKLMHNQVPSFKVFKANYKEDIFEWLNNRRYAPNSHYFIYNNYSPIGGRNFFTEENAIKIDGIRFDIEDLYQKGIISENEYYYLIASLLDCVTRYSNTSGTYEAFFKFWENRAIKPFIIEPLDIMSCANVKNAICYQEHSNDLIRKIEGDILYIDPPYTVTQYASAYNILETIALIDEPIIKGVGGKRGKGKCVSNYCYKNKAKEEFEDLFRQAKFSDIVLSYSNQGVVPLEEMIELAKKFAKEGIVHVEYMNYQEYQNHRSSNKRNGKTLTEVIIYFKKDVTIIKSPLNYAGSKDRMFTAIQRSFPKHIGTFVDVMGGAFNVGVNVYAMEKVVYNDINPYIHGIVRWLITTPKEQQIEIVNNIINTFELGKANETAYNHLREYYNTKDNSIPYLFVLHMYAFQNYIRFNAHQRFNTPIGVAGYSEDLEKRITLFKAKTKEIGILNEDFQNIKWSDYPLDTLFYFDPPYLITKAAYNDGKRGLEGWTMEIENKLFTCLDMINSMGYKFMLSNVKEHKSQVNEHLIKWVKKNHYNLKELGVSGWRYAKNEIIVTNY